MGLSQFSYFKKYQKRTAITHHMYIGHNQINVYPTFQIKN